MGRDEEFDLAVEALDLGVLGRELAFDGFPRKLR
jgi:hypothetical protein